MILKILTDLNEEINRLFIAGAKFATGDLRITKMSKDFETLAEKSPIMEQIHKKIKDMLISKEPEKALLELSVFVQAILNTQSATSINDLTEAIHEPLFDHFPDEQAPYSKLIPLHEALTTKGSGRLQKIVNAYLDRITKDFRMFSQINKGLEESYAELPKYLLDVVIPDIGKPIESFLLKSLNIEDKKIKTATVRRFNALNTIGHEHIEDLAIKALDSNSNELIVEAIKSLGYYKNHEERLIEYTKSKKENIKKSAIYALVMMDSTVGKDLMLKYVETYTYNQTYPNYILFDDIMCSAIVCKDEIYNKKLLELVEIDLNNATKVMKKSQYLIRDSIIIAASKNTKEARELLKKGFFSDVKSKVTTKHNYINLINIKNMFYYAKKYSFRENLLQVFEEMYKENVDTKSLNIVSSGNEKFVMSRAVVKDFIPSLTGDHFLECYLKSCFDIYTEAEINKIFSPYFSPGYIKGAYLEFKGNLEQTYY